MNRQLAPAGPGSVGVYNITIGVVDSDTLTDQANFTITVYDYNEEPPQMGGPWPGPLYADYQIGEFASVDLGDGDYDSQTNPANLTYALVDAPPYASITSAGLFTWTRPTLPSSGPVDASWYTAYRFVVKTTDDGSVSDTPRNEYYPAFISANADVDLDGTRTKAGASGQDERPDEQAATHPGPLNQGH